MYTKWGVLRSLQFFHSIGWQRYKPPCGMADKSVPRADESVHLGDTMPTDLLPCYPRIQLTALSSEVCIRTACGASKWAMKPV